MVQNKHPSANFGGSLIVCLIFKYPPHLGGFFCLFIQKMPFFLHISNIFTTFAPYFVTMPSKYTRITYVRYTYDTRRIYVILCFRYANKTTVSAMLGGSQTPQSIWLKSSHPLPLTISVANSVAKTASSCVPVTAKRTLTLLRTRTPDPPPKRRTPCAPPSVWPSNKPQSFSKIPSRKPIGSAAMPPTASTIVLLHPPITTPPSAVSSSPPSTPN